ncbi:MAG TPA: Holliday junction branch migration DNA helicase RuvB, partial [bacterium]|nr:Holliday junction branch migration DNA helicase RuvB [bacterium]
MEDRLVGSEIKFEDSSLEGGLRPQNLSGYIGQKTVVDNIKIYIEAAKRNDRQLDHLLLAGPPGLGKTTLSQIVANEMGVKIFITSGPAIEKKGDLAGLLTSLKEKDVLFIDEIHRLNASVEESLYSAMEDFFFDIMLGEGAHAKSMRLPIEPFTLIGATTKTGSLSSPLRDRFQIVFRMDYYSVEELKKIVERSSEILGIKTSSEGAL